MKGAGSRDERPRVLVVDPCERLPAGLRDADDLQVRVVTGPDALAMTILEHEAVAARWASVAEVDHAPDLAAYGGLPVIGKLMRADPELKVIVVSTTMAEGCQTTLYLNLAALPLYPVRSPEDVAGLLKAVHGAHRAWLEDAADRAAGPPA